MTRLLVIRHGQTDFNLENRLQGSLDVPLNAVGEKQARSAGLQLHAAGLDAIVSSPLSRALQTAEIIAAELGDLPVEIMPHFTQRVGGKFEGLTPQEVRLRFPDLYAARVSRQIFHAPPGGETVMEVALRVYEGMLEIRRCYPGLQVLLVSHGFISRIIYGFFNHITDEQFYRYELLNGEYATYELGESPLEGGAV